MATQEERQKGQACLDELAAIVNRCLIRRTSALLSKYLPVKTEQVICIKLTDIQQKIYSKFIASDAIKRTVQGEISMIQCEVLF
jgi:DNA repair and recombination RAD54-like protein